MKECSGYGECLNNSEYTCIHSCQKCLNYEFCKKMGSKRYFECYNGICQGCDIRSFIHKKNRILEFRDTSEPCCVCLEQKGREMKFPSECGHWFCIDCSRDLILWDETRYHINPVLFGCPPCPNKCKNPDRGKQCYCEEYDEILEKWREEYPEKSKLYNELEQYNIEHGHEKEIVYGKGICPLCRSKY